MKRFFIMAAAAMALAGCSQTELDHAPAGQKGIKFSNLNDKVNTRAANDSSDNYRVYAAWSSGTTWYINDAVNGSTDIPQAGPYYWPSAGTVDFYAWAPSTVTATGVYPDLSIDYTVPDAGNHDFTIAAPRTGLSAGTVDFIFSHMLSKISVKATLHQDLTDAGYVLTTTGLAATLTVQSTGGTIEPTAAAPAWTSPNTTVGEYTGAASYMIMPQTSTGCKVQVTSDIEITKNGTVVYTGNLSEYIIATGNVTGNQFEMGKHYLLNLTISDVSTGGGGENIFNIINFSSSVADWDSPAGNDTPLEQP